MAWSLLTALAATCVNPNPISRGKHKISKDGF